MSVSSLALILPPVPENFPAEKILSTPSEFGYAPQLTTVALGSYIKEREPSAPVFLFDGNVLNFGEICSELKKTHPDIIGMSPNSVNYPSALRIARFAKKIGSLIFFGGHYATALAEEILLNRGPRSNDHCVDGIIIHDGEEALWQIVSGRPFSQISNLAYQGKSGIIFNEVQQLDIDLLPFPDFSLAAQRKDQGFKFLSVFSGKGCSWRADKGGCLFCMLMDRGFRRKSPRRFYQEIDELIETYHPEVIFDVSDNFLDDKVWLNEFHSLYHSRPEKPQWQCYARIDDFTPEMAKKLKEIGVNRIIFGVESNDDGILGAFGKGYTAEKNTNAVKLMESSDIWARINFVVGGVGESRESVERTLEFARWTQKILKNKVFYFSYVLMPYPGSRAFDLLVKKTGRKYLDQDVLDYKNMAEDWFKYFCRISLAEASKYVFDINNLNGDYHSLK